MTAYNAIRFLQFEAAKCRDRDACEALCLLLPVMVRVFDLEPMEDVEAAAFRYQFKQALQKLPFQDEADRACARPAVLAQPMHPDPADEANDVRGPSRNCATFAGAHLR